MDDDSWTDSYVRLSGILHTRRTSCARSCWSSGSCLSDADWCLQFDLQSDLQSDGVPDSRGPLSPPFLGGIQVALPGRRPVPSHSKDPRRRRRLDTADSAAVRVGDDPGTLPRLGASLFCARRSHFFWESFCVPMQKCSTTPRALPTSMGRRVESARLGGWVEKEGGAGAG